MPEGNSDTQDLTVHVLNFHGVFSHIEIVLEDNSFTPAHYFGINRWNGNHAFWSDHNLQKDLINKASSVYSFTIKANPNNIAFKWNEYLSITNPHILGNNCAVAAQWFLHKFAGIPEPSLNNISFNHLAFGVMWPSFIPCPVTLPGRVMSNVKYHCEKNTENNPEKFNQYTQLFFAMSLSLATLIQLPYSLALFGLAIVPLILSPVVEKYAPADIKEYFGFSR